MGLALVHFQKYWLLSNLYVISFFLKVEVVEVQEVQAPEVQGMEVPVQKAAQTMPKVKKARPSVH